MGGTRGSCADICTAQVCGEGWCFCACISACWWRLLTSADHRRTGDRAISLMQGSLLSAWICCQCVCSSRDTFLPNTTINLDSSIKRVKISDNHQCLAVAQSTTMQLCTHDHDLLLTQNITNIPPWLKLRLQAPPRWRNHGIHSCLCWSHNRLRDESGLELHLVEWVEVSGVLARRRKLPMIRLSRS